MRKSPVIAIIVFATSKETSMDHPACLSDCEISIMAQLAAGHTATDIADNMHLTEQTVSLFVSSACRKLGARTRMQAMALFIASGGGDQTINIPVGD